ncbi:DIS3-like exonuclease 2 isoform X2 [Coffea eugenioides]|uniref:DIS3-like exonuclease 2 isoform X2 n=1 Tax=Coffea eugenioides TaxID=49369 RepID=UPI000F6148EF|nr:DIS3-like exonuclease 2 isoform X2 [Coffea eugenioides]
MGGGAIAESSQSQSDRTAANYNSSNAVDVKDGKKKKRRSRRTKQNSSIPASSGSVNNEIHVGETELLDNVGSNENQVPRASDVAFSSLPVMHVTDQKSECEKGSLQNQHSLEADDENGSVISNCCPEAIFGCQVLKDSDVDVDVDPMPSHRGNGRAQRKYFASHWPEEAVTKALENGEVFKALFRVNAHNRLEAYCKIDGLPTDVLINGFLAQNRAVEGDIVAIRVDPPSLWTKMKGFTATVENPAAVNGCNLHAEAATVMQDCLKGKNKVDMDSDCSDCGHFSTPKNRLCYKNGYCSEEIVCPEFVGASDKGYLNGPCSLMSDDLGAGCFIRSDEAVYSVAKLCGIVNSFPSKRPTGRVVSIIERSPRRYTILGFLGVKQLIRSREVSSKDSKKNKFSSFSVNHEFIMLTPTDPKFPKMMLSLKSLPPHIENRLMVGDATVEMDLVAASIVDWVEESNVPEARVTHSFGRGGEIEAHIAAILYENLIDASEFAPETLSCLPHGPWEVPQKEFESRRDLRKLCIFTIDPSTATDLDDALSVETLANGISRVGVHIADVSYFVLPDTALDIDAQIRSTSVYMLQQKLPMLPPLLSDNFGSLNPGVDRLAFSMFWDINPTGEVLDRWIGRTIICSCCKLSYEQTEDIIDDRFDVRSSNFLLNNWPDLHGCFEWSDVITSVKNLNEISRILKKRRLNDGALSLESPKIVFLFDEDGIPYDSVIRRRKGSEFLVEEFMLLANKTAAEVITRAYPSSALLRRHPGPNLRKLREFEAFCNRNGLMLDSSSSAQLHRSFERIRGELKNDSVMFDILMSYASRPMQLAAYFCSGDTKDGESDKSHYALAVPLYTHFTSPLRRYPDIVVHRTLAATLEAEETCMKHRESLQKLDANELMGLKCFTGVQYLKDIVESVEAQESLSAAASKHGIPSADIIADVAAHCNDRKLATRHVSDATNKLYTWALLRKKEVLCLEARVLGLGPRFMSIYIHRLAVERRIYYDDVEGLAVEWLDETSTLVLSRYTSKHHNRRGSPGKCRRLEEVAWIVSPADIGLRQNLYGRNGSDKDKADCQIDGDVILSATSENLVVEPAVFPLTVHLLSTIPVALHAVGGDDGPIDIGARLYVSSYFR